MYGLSDGSPRGGRTPRRAALAAAVAVAALAAAACAPSTSNTGSQSKKTDGAPFPQATIDTTFDLDAVVAAAKKEGSLTVYDSSGDIKKIATAFEAKYGIKMTGVKSKVGATLQKMTREAQAHNVTIDVAMYEDGPTLVGQLLPQKVTYTWIPGDLADDIPERSRNPLTVVLKPDIWVYNDKIFPNGCPINTIWDLASPDWKGKVAMQDPLGKPNLIEYFTQLAASGNDAIKDAYQAEYGKELKTSESSAAAEWIKQLAKNSPVLTSADEDTATAVGSPQQTQPRIGLMSGSKFRDIEDKGFHLKVCEGLKPWPGFLYPKYVTIATNTSKPNAAKLFVHFVMTKEGIEPETLSGGGVSGNSAVGQLGVKLPGLPDWDALFAFDNSDLVGDFRNGQDMQDFWRLNHG